MLFLEQCLEPLIEGTSVVARISLVVCGNADDYKGLLGELLLLEPEEVDHLSVLNVYYSNLSQNELAGEIGNSPSEIWR